uniref:phenylalanine--tRNA ligase n=1 Tax=Eucampia antarctica TaxID=49252 RepID=A0A7S2S3U2_9STRA|mmetsp:Transcript_30355/g.29253  ORF Transcript_30355/g.29253 Transcript_30355/m.29253 type:complete len:649 (+) Transcript_30355:84-2030(+)
MPTVAIERSALMRALGKEYSAEEFDELCFEFGIELDEVTSERLEAEKGGRVLTDEMSSEEIYKIDVPANRYDLLCIEGLVRALRIFLGEYGETPSYHVVPPTREMKVFANETKRIRPYIVCAILRGLELNEDRYQSLMDLQDQLHRNLCRQRTLVAIGTHDLDSIPQGEEELLTYRALPPEDIHFVPLTEEEDGRKWQAKELMHFYETNVSAKHLKPYVPIIKDSDVYPLVSCGDTVLSLPPIINGRLSRITLDTKNMLIECTATDLTKAHVVLDTMCTMFGQYTSPQSYTVEQITVNYYDDNEQIIDSYASPRMHTRQESAPVDFINSLIGINITAQDMVALCDKLQLGPAHVVTSDEQKNSQALVVNVPPTRSDILHAVDIAEDIGIAYGYNNIVKLIPKTCTVGGEQPLNHLSDLLREEIARAGYMEVLTHGLCSRHENFAAVGKTDGGAASAVSLSNPANVEYEVIRTSLLTGLLKTLQHNKSSSFANGFQIFEVSDVVLPDDKHVSCQSIVGAKNLRRVCAVYAGPTSGFEIVHGLVDRILSLCEVAPNAHYISKSNTYEDKFKISKPNWEYDIVPFTAEEQEQGGQTYFPGRAAKVLFTKPDYNDGKPICIGTFGILHPNVLQAFDIHHPASCLELDLDPLI